MEGIQLRHEFGWNQGMNSTKVERDKLGWI